VVEDPRLHQVKEVFHRFIVPLKVMVNQSPTFIALLKVGENRNPTFIFLLPVMEVVRCNILAPQEHTFLLAMI